MQKNTIVLRLGELCKHCYLEKTVFDEEQPVKGLLSTLNCRDCKQVGWRESERVDGVFEHYELLFDYRCLNAASFR